MLKKIDSFLAQSIRRRLFFYFAIILAGTIIALSSLLLTIVTQNIVEGELQEMHTLVDKTSLEIDALHDKAIEDIRFASQNELFVEYFDLPETRTGNTFQEGVLQFTDRQNEIKSQLEAWMFNFQNKFDVDETCIIDTTGQEHARLILRRAETDVGLTTIERTTPYFEPSFHKEKEEVYVAYPYISPNTDRWVFAYTTPVVLSDGEKSAIFHFEMPLTVLYQIIAEKVEDEEKTGEIYLIDPVGDIIIDSDDDSFLQVPSKPFPIIESAKPTKFESLFSNEIKKIKHGITYYEDDNGKKIHIVYKQIPHFGWYLVYEKPDSAFFAGTTSLADLGGLVAIITGAVGIIGFVITASVSSRIANPIVRLAKQCMNINPQKLTEIKVNTNLVEIIDVRKAINSMIKKIHENDIQKEEHIAMISHELKTPLTPLFGYLDMLLNPELEIDKKEKFKIYQEMNSCIQRLNKTTLNLLDVVKLDLDQMKFTKEKFNAKELLKKVLNSYQVEAKNRSVEISSSCDEELILNSDEAKIRHVLDDFIQNSFKFIKENGKIEIGIKKQDNNVLFYVKDNGQGIPDEKKSKIFKEKFWQADTSLTREEGTGLGLAICKGIVEKLGGNIGFKSTYGKETEFFFTIPI